MTTARATGWARPCRALCSALLCPSALTAAACCGEQPHFTDGNREAQAWACVSASKAIPAKISWSPWTLLDCRERNSSPPLFQHVSCGVGFSFFTEAGKGRNSVRGERPGRVLEPGRDYREPGHSGELSPGVSRPLPCLLKLSPFAFSFCSTSLCVLLAFIFLLIFIFFSFLSNVG